MATFEKWLEEQYPETERFVEFGPYDMQQAWDAGFKAAARIIRPTGRRQDPAERDNRILGYVSKNPGLSVEEITAGLNQGIRSRSSQLFPAQVRNSLISLALDGRVTFGLVTRRTHPVRIWDAAVTE
jgi:hypothetical protein